MSKREKIILVVMLLAVIYGIYAIFLSSPKKVSFQGTEAELETLDKLVTEMSQQEDLSEKDAYTIAMAEEGWPTDPFYKKEVSWVRASYEPSGSTADAPQEVSFNYTGYMETDRKRLAIINGVEYQTGEELDPGGYIVQGIFDNRVLIEVKGKQRRIVVPIVEEIL